ncbi:GMC family oxidoreductase N-terminal domain-containing protein [Lutimaribacter sp. EGI FJ00015]|uniref:GMC family oxidoreductase N-terminal domain-containing protein n=1 Tax=Lutimaribacter degradans TaxID=2945989 RepID=A0ACC5ZU36_9RHOB|nr:GMC family oxidoreductase N-terminal domain-containing protein [Lutimaribacter sp. EGI FJ00013]MCM2561700.1 GMC family oxidoreductase N-terminal domain-containing protein [Lutimaribacter sp. EGI FJ00013]MCO0612587.1 GMC family oxidoreductase N-terminal domain-containing protein [Lutimaribacter sp. EGI FJ00015]MCO0635246.1 GMC family oxidoreductase N-terminal domain-containing protein [Lutimaribacter sp. EGI FJ00014]
MYDTIIVGAGSAGCVLAARLTEDPNRNVLLVEAGGEPPINSRVPSDWVTLFNTAADWGYYTVAQEGCLGRRIFWPRGKMMGGSGSMNAMIYIRGLPSDFDGWAAKGCEGWDWESVMPDFVACEHNREYGNTPYHGTNGPLHVQNPTYVHDHERDYVEAGIAAGYKRNDDFNGADQEGFGFYQFTIRDGERHGTYSAYLKPIQDRPNLKIIRGATVMGVSFDGTRANGIRYFAQGDTHFAEGEKVVLTAGAIGTPQILMLSGVGPADHLRALDLEVVHHSAEVGGNLSDHINIPISFYTKDAVGVGAWDAEFLTKSLAEWETTGDGPRAVPWVSAGAHIRSREGIEPDLQLYGAVSPHRDYGRFMSVKPGMTLHSVLQRPNSKGRIKLRSSSPFEAPDIDPAYFSSDPTGEDLATLVRAVRIQREIANSEPLADRLDGEMQPSSDCQTEQEIETYVRGHCTTLYHAAGTCRMGTDEAAVVNSSTFQVNGVDGLYVADASLFPEMISGNTNATTIMIAERAARVI